MKLYIVKIIDNDEIKTACSFDKEHALALDVEAFLLNKNELDRHLESDILPFRRETVLKCGNEGDKYRSIAASYALKKAIEGAEYLDAVLIGEISAGYSDKGKLCFYRGLVSGDIPFYVSLSHSRDIAVCLVSDLECGVDVESISRFKEMLDKNGKHREAFIKKFLDDEEYDFFLNISDPDEKAEYLAKCWTKKEAYVKYTGEGIGTLTSVHPKNAEAVICDGYAFGFCNI